LTAESDIVVRRLDAADRERWDAFVHACPRATFFHLSGWSELIERVFGHRTWYLYAERAGRIVAVLPLAEIKSTLFGHSLSSLPFCVYGGIAGDSDAAPVLEARADEIARQIGVEYLEYRNVDPRHDDWPRQSVYATFRKPILSDDDANMQAIPRKQRAMVRKGIKHGLRSEIDPDVDRFFALYADNMLRHGTPALPRKFFAALARTFAGHCEVLTVVDGTGRALSSVLSFYFRDEVLPYYAGDHVGARDLAANDFKYWELLRRACLRGCKVFDYGRSKQGTGPWSFKKNWGFEPKTLAYEYRLYKTAEVPQKNPLNPRYRLFVALWKLLPAPLAGALGPPIARHLG
jgi:FemAB-related protein (PEP-CTERM system-associated)